MARTGTDPTAEDSADETIEPLGPTTDPEADRPSEAGSDDDVAEDKARTSPPESKSDDA